MTNRDSKRREGLQASKASHKRKPNYRQAHLQVLRAFFADWPEVREGQMFGYPAFFVGRKMFACLYGPGVGVKVPATMVPALLQRPANKWFEPMGRRRMREWIQIDHERSNDYLEERAVFQAAVRYAETSLTGSKGPA